MAVTNVAPQSADKGGLKYYYSCSVRDPDSGESSESGVSTGARGGLGSEALSRAKKFHSRHRSFSPSSFKSAPESLSPYSASRSDVSTSGRTTPFNQIIRGGVLLQPDCASEYDDRLALVSQVFKQVFPEGAVLVADFKVVCPAPQVPSGPSGSNDLVMPRPSEPALAAPALVIAPAIPPYTEKEEATTGCSLFRCFRGKNKVGDLGS